MKRFLVHQCVQLVVVCLGISIITFLLLHLKGDPVTLLLPLDAGKEEMASFRRQMGFDQPLYVQYVRFLLGAIQGDFGVSLYMKKSAFALVLERMPATLLLTFAGLFMSLVLAIPLGIISARRPYALLDNLCTTLAVGGQAMPIFWLGIMLIILFSVRLHWLPASGFGTWSHLVLPATTLGFFLAPLTMRLVRSGMLEVLSQDYVRTARAKGVSEWLVICHHALVNAALPLVTVAGLQFGLLLGGAIITETVFAVPGVGRLIVGAIRQLDFPIVQAGVFLLALIVVLVNFAVDILYIYLNPQIRVR